LLVDEESIVVHDDMDPSFNDDSTVFRAFPLDIEEKKNAEDGSFDKISCLGKL